MDTIERFRALYKESNTTDMIPFLSHLTDKEKKDIIKETARIRQAKARGDEYITLAQDDIIAYCNLFCLSKKDLKHIQFVWRDLPRFEQMESLLEKHIPAEFPELYAQVLASRPNHVTYQSIMPWVRKGYVDKELLKPFLAVRMSGLFPRNTETADPVAFINSRLAEYPEILAEQIWYLFEYPNEVSYSDKLNTMKVDGKTGPWTYIFKTYSADGRIDRMHLMQTCFEALNRNFKKDQLHWYIDIFEALAPAKEELLTLQDELFASLSSTLSKQVNMSLKMIKEIRDEKAFRKEDFLQLAPMLLASEVKATVTATLGVLELLAKTDKASAEQLCLSAATAFISKDEAVQTRAAKLIAKYGNPASEELKATVQTYAGQLLMAVRPLLGDYLATAQAPPKAVQPQTGAKKEEKPPLPVHIREDNRLGYVANREDLLFRLGQAISRFTPADFYLIPEALLRLQGEMTAEALDKLAPSIQLAYKRIDPWEPSRPYFLDLMCHFFLDYCKVHIERLAGKPMMKSLETIGWSEQSRTYRKEHAPQPAYKGYELLMDEYLDKVKAGNHLPLLATPTHAPTWLDPQALIFRLKQYQEAGATPGTMDMQQALQLCSLQSPGTILPLIDKGLEGEYRDLLNWYFDCGASLPAVRPHPAWWLTAAMMQTGRSIPGELLAGYETIPAYMLAGTFAAEPYIDEYISHTEYNPETKQQEPVTCKSPRIRIEMQDIYGKDTQDTQLFAGHSFSWTDRRLANIGSLMLSMPNNWQTQLAYQVRAMQYMSSTTEKYLLAVLGIFRETETPMRGLDYTYMAYCMISADKTVRAYAGETWAEMVGKNTTNSHALGQAIGAYAKVEYAPLKRLTDLLDKNMLGISPRHNRALEQLITALLASLPETPINGLKKLMEIHKEVQAQNMK